jgi:parvulin-like peptidyl-prolyl isomerase
VRSRLHVKSGRRFAILGTVTTPNNKLTPILEVNGEPIFAHEIRARVSLLRTRAEASEKRELSPDERFALRPEAIQDLVDTLIMRQEALHLKLQPTEAEIDAALAAAAPKSDGTAGCRADAASEESRQETLSNMLIERLLTRWFESLHPPKSTEIREFYRRNEAAFFMPERIAASHIVLHAADGETLDDSAAIAMLEKAREEILAGADFAETAARVSSCPENGGDLGYFPRGVMVDEFDAIVFSTPVGEVTKPFHTQFGWHIVHVRDRRPEGTLPFEEVAARIAQRFLRDKQERQVSTKLLALRSKARIVELGAV